LEFNPVPGIPDVDFCVRGIEGKIELKDRPQPPVRANTPAFGEEKGLRGDQIGWISRRVKHRGRVFILGEVGRLVFLVGGWHARQFNSMTIADLQINAVWWNREEPLSRCGPSLITALITDYPLIGPVAPRPSRANR
jgi:hypothetical protein